MSRVLAIIGTVMAPAIHFNTRTTYCGLSTYWAMSTTENFHYGSHTHVIHSPNILNLSIDIISCNLGLVWTPTAQLVTPMRHAENPPLSQTRICSVWLLHVEFIHVHHCMLSAVHLDTLLQPATASWRLPKNLLISATHTCCVVQHP
jgi:hypothetical protein